MLEAGIQDIVPPAGAPPILSEFEIWHISFHGWLPISLPDSLLEDIRIVTNRAAEFFDKSHEQKLNLYPSSSGTENGFYHVPDEKEYITFRHHVYPDSALEQTVKRVWSQVAYLLHRVLCDLSRAGCLDPTSWEAMLKNALEIPGDNSQVEDAITLLRLFRYYPAKGFAIEHVDIGLLTLCVGDGKGLQVVDRSQKSPSKWMDAIGPVILVGDMVRNLFKGHVQAGLHRVVSNPDGRSSFVFALRPNLDGTIDLSQFAGGGVVSTREYFYKIKGSKFNINATKDIRDEQREKQKKNGTVEEFPVAKTEVGQ